MMAVQGTDLRVYQTALGVILLLYSLSKNTLHCFPRGPWPIYFQVLGNPKAVEYGFHLMELVLSQISHWLLTHISFESLLP